MKKYFWYNFILKFWPMNWDSLESKSMLILKNGVLFWIEFTISMSMRFSSWAGPDRLIPTGLLTVSFIVKVQPIILTLKMSGWMNFTYKKLKKTIKN